MTGGLHNEPDVPDTSTIVRWRTLHRQLQEKLTASPHHPSAWIWGIRRDIFAYLIQRYDDPSNTPQQIRFNAAYFLGLSPSDRELDEPPSASSPGYPVTHDVPETMPGTAPRSGRKIGAVLQRLARLNRARHSAVALEIAVALEEQKQRIADAQSDNFPDRSGVRPAKKRPEMSVHDLPDMADIARRIESLMIMQSTTHPDRLVIDEMDDEAFFEFMTTPER